jgi:uncharacterized heparinase superfamily protein
MNDPIATSTMDSSTAATSDDELQHSRLKSWVYQLHYMIPRSSRDYTLQADWLKQQFVILPEGDALAGKQFLSREFRFFDETHTFGREPVWNPPKAGMLWLIRMHGFEWISDIRAYNDSAITASQLREYIADWIEQSGSTPAIARHPTVIGQRVSAWLMHANFILSGSSVRFKRRFVRSLARQAMMLARAVLRLQGRASFAAIQGLLCASRAIPHAAFFEPLAMHRLALAINTQIRPDGAHVTRCGSVHLEQLECLHNIGTILRSMNVQHELLYAAVTSMQKALTFMTHPDGKLALFNDSVEERPGRIKSALASLFPGLTSFKDYAVCGDYIRLQGGTLRLMIETGVPSPHSAHSHFGSLSFELSDGAHRMIVNCGGYRGAKPEWRRACKSTAAHSTLCVSEENAYPKQTASALSFLHEPRTTTKHSEAEHYHELETSYNGYESLFGLVHERTLRVLKSGKRFEGSDHLTQIHTDAMPTDYPVHIRFHLHPSVQVTKLQDRHITLSLPSGNHWVFTANTEEHPSVEESIYTGADGKPQKSSQIVLSSRSNSKMNSRILWSFEHSQ